MATVLGAGSVLGTSLGSLGPDAAWFLEPGPVSLRYSARGVPSETVASRSRRDESKELPVDPPETLDLLARIVWLLGSAAPGLSLSDLRVHLSEPAEALQRALVAGLRTKRLRRVGAHNKLRYLLNA